MNQSGAYGDDIGRRFRLRMAPSISASVRPGAYIAATHVSCGKEGVGKTLPIPVQPALIVCVQFRPLIHKLWMGGRSVPVDPWPVAAISVVDLQEEPSAFFGGALDGMQVYMPRTSLAAMAESNETRVISDLVIPNGTVDIVAYQLSLLMLPATEHPDQANQIFLSGLMQAFYGHLSEKYGNTGPKVRLPRGGLSPWQLTRAKELIDANLSGAVSLAFLASECGLSPSHFSRAFKRSVGIAPHQWLLLRRVEVAKRFLERESTNFLEIAHATGFSDQSHLIRVFSKLVGVTPREWRILYGRRSAKTRQVP